MIKRKPHILALYNYLDEIQKRNKKITLDEVFYSIKGDSLKVLRYYLEKDKSLINKSFPFCKDVAGGFTHSVGLLSLAAKYGRSDIISYLESLVNTKWDYSQALAWAPISNNFTLVQYFSEKVEDKQSNEKTFIRNAATVGSIQMLDWFGTWIGDSSSGGVFSLIVTYMRDVLIGSIIGNHLNVIRHYYGHIPLRPFHMVYKLAAQFNRLDILQYLHNRDYFSEFLNETDAMDCASKNGHIEVLEWLHYNCSALCSFTAMNSASQNGHLETIKWLHSNRTEGCTYNAMNYASLNGHLDVLKWLHSNRTEGCTTDAMDYAASNGHLEVLKWLHSNRTEGCTTDAMDFAARNGHLEVVKWLPLNTTLKYSSVTVHNAAIQNHLEILKWLDEYYDRMNYHVHPDNSIDSAAIGGNLEVIKWFHEYYPKACTSKAMDSAASNGHLDVIIWLHENRTEGCTTRALDYAMINSHFDIAQWLYENRTEGCTRFAIKFVSRYYPEMEQWVHDRRLQPVNQNRILKKFTQQYSKLKKLLCKKFKKNK